MRIILAKCFANTPAFRRTNTAATYNALMTKEVWFMAQWKPHQNNGYFTEYINSILPKNLVYYNIKNQPFALYGLYAP